MTEEEYHVLLQYIQVCVQRKDWHAVRDLAVDAELAEALNPDLRDPD